MDANLTLKSSMLKAAIIGILILQMGVFIPSAMAGSVERRLQEILTNPIADDLVPVIIRLSDQANLTEIRDEDRHVKRAKIIAALKDKAEKTQGPLQGLLMSGGVADGKNLWLVNGIAVKVPVYLINEIASFPGVEEVSVDAVVQAPPVAKTTVLQSAEWNISRINAPSMWSMGFTGQNIVVANMDTGVDVTHPALSGSWRGGINSWYNPYALPANSADCAVANSCTSCELNSTIPCDLEGHGTNTMGIMIGGVVNVPGPDPLTGFLGSYAIGVAPGAKWIGVKVLNDNGSGLTSIIIEGYQWVLNPNGNPAIPGAPDIINNSWDYSSPGCYLGSDSVLLSAIQNVRAAEIAVVFAAGNNGASGAGSGNSPAVYPPSFSVGSTNSSDVISTFSSLGPNSCNGAIFPNIVSPGEKILVADPVSPLSPIGYAVGAGTSYSAPHAAGALALLKSAFPNKKVADLETALMLSAVPLGNPSPNNTYGYGRIDVLAAYNYLNAARIYVTPPSSSYNYGNVGLIKSSSVQFTVSSTGGSNLAIGTISITGVDSSQFVKQSDTCSGQSVATGGTCTVSVVFSPATLGGKSATLLIPSNALGEATLTIALSGVGFTPPTTSIGLFRSGNWYLDSNANFAWDPGIDATMDFGMGGDVPVVGNWNGSADGKSKIGVFRNGWWYLDYPDTGIWVGCGAPNDPTKDECILFGMTGDIPVVGDWNGDGKVKIGVFRNGWWYLDYPDTGIWVGCGAPNDPTKDECILFGMTGDIPVVGDWNGDGKVKIGVFRNGWWYLDYPDTGIWVGCGAPNDPTKDECILFGMTGDIPIVGDWNGDGKVKIGVFRNGWWYLDYNGNGQWDGCGAPGDLTKDACFEFGLPADTPILGKW